MRRQRRTRLAQRGQALVFVTLTMLVVLLALLTMYSMGQLSTAKMKLQNTADAGAYSAALAQARDYNFAAYTNRAMVANQVAVAQLVGLASWARNLNDTFATLVPAVDWMSQGPIQRFTWNIASRILRPAARGLNRVVDAAAPVMVKVLDGIILALRVGQMGYHYGTALTVAQTLGADAKFFGVINDLTGIDLSVIGTAVSFGNNYNVVNMNDKDASLSVLGLVAFAYNTYEWFNFTNEKDPTLGVPTPSGAAKKHDGANSERFAKVTTSSMDGFYDIRTLLPFSTTPAVPMPWLVPMAIDPTLIFGAPRVYGMFMFLFHRGGTELRNNNKTWSAMDVTSFFGLVTVPIFIPPFGPFLNIPIIPYFVPPIGAGAGGAAQAGVSSPLNPANNFSRDAPTNYKSFNEAYGKAFWPGAFPDFGLAGRQQQGRGAGASMDASTRGGLQKYYDVADIGQAADPNPDDHANTSSPPIIVEVEKPSNLIPTSATGKLRVGRAGSSDGTDFCTVLPSTSRRPPAVTALAANGNLDVGDGTASGCMRALSKAEAYFSRPSDLFPRGDGKTEYGSLYSPYWQARLLPNSLPEQALSLVLQGLSFSNVASWFNDYKNYGK